MPSTDAALIIALGADIRSLKKSMQDALGISGTTARSIENRNKQMVAKMNAQMAGIGSTLKRALGTIGLAIGAREIMAYADKWQEFGNRLRMVGFAGGEVQTALEGIYQAAQKSDQKMAPMVDTFARLVSVRGSLGASGSDANLAKFTEALGLGAKVSGRTVEGDSGVVDQLLVAFQKGTFSSGAAGRGGGGRGLRTILADMPALAQAAANGLDAAGGSVIKLTQLMTTGKVAPKAFFDAILKGLSGLEESAGKDLGTVEEAWTRFDNSMGRFIGTASLSVAASHGASAGLDFLGSHLQDVTNAATVLAGALAPMGIAAAARGAYAAVLALSTLIVANPWMFAITVLAGLATAMYLYASSGRTVADALKDEKKAQDDLNTILAEAIKNGGKITADKLAEAGARHYNARMALEEAVALAKVADQKAKGELNMGDRLAAAIINSPGTPMGAPGLDAKKSPYQQLLERQASDASANVKNAKNDLTDFDERWADAKLKVEAPPKIPDIDDPRAAQLAQRRAELLARATAGEESAQADLVKASSEAQVEMLRGADGYYGALRAKVDEDADAEIKAINAKRDEELVSLKKMEAGWAGYGAAKAKINAEADAKVATVNVKRTADLGGAGADLQERTKELKDHVATLGMTSDAADRALVSEKTLAIASALEAGGHNEAATALRGKLAAYLAMSQGAELADRAMQNNVEEADALRSGLENIGAAGVHGFKSMKAAAAQMLDQIVEMIIRLEIMEPLIESMFGQKGTKLSIGGGGSSSGGWLSSIGSAIWDAIPGFASGTDYAPGGPALVHKDELINLPRGSQVIPRAPSMAMLRGSMQNNSMSYQNFGGNVVVQGDTDGRSLRLMKAMLDQRDAQFESRWMATHQKFNRTK